MLHLYIIYLPYMKGEKWPHSRGEMAIGTYSQPMELLALIVFITTDVCQAIFFEGSSRLWVEKCLHVYFSCSSFKQISAKATTPEN